MTSRVAIRGLVVAAICLHLQGWLVAGNFTLQVLHTNDMHARFIETDVYCSSCPDDYVALNKCFGGFARCKAAANSYTEWARSQNITSIFLNAGDTFQGTPYYTIFKWNISASIVNSMGYDAICLGNHEFDDGVDNLIQFLEHLQVPVVCANLNLSMEPRLKKVSNLKPSTVLNVGGKKIGIIGYLTPDTMNIANTEKVNITEEIPAIRAQVQILKSAGVDIIIGLGHSGLDVDKVIAAQVDGLNLIVGGHSHDLLYTPKDNPPSVEKAKETYPYLVKQESGKIVPIVQSYAYAKYLGRILITFDDNNNVISANGNSILMDHSVGKDPNVDEIANAWASKVESRLKTVLGYTRVFLDKSTFHPNPLQFESNLANLVTDAMLYSAVELAKQTNSTQWTNATIAFYQNGGLRSRIDNKKNDGAITIEDVLTLLPFQNDIYECSFSGTNVKLALEYSVRTFNPVTMDYVPYFLHFAGMRVVYNVQNAPGNRVEYAEVLCANCSVPKYEPLDESRNYVAVVPAFLMDGGDFFDMLRIQAKYCKKIGITDTSSVTNYVEKNQIVYPAIEGRFTLKGLGQPSAATKISSSLLFFVLLPTIVTAFIAS